MLPGFDEDVVGEKGEVVGKCGRVTGDDDVGKMAMMW